jgi:hypothetical protein
VATLLAAGGLLAGRRWGWVASIVLSAVSLAFAIGGWWDNNPTFLAMAINTVAIFYLNQREVRAYFGEATEGGELEP